MRYADAGVDQDRKDRAIEDAQALIASTFTAGVIPNPGGFAGLFALKRMRDPVLVACTDGVGTKVKLATQLGRHDTVGIDLVAMSVNDLIVQGAEPLFFLDYIALGKTDPGRVRSILEGVVAGCREAGCALLGGETAEMPGVYAEGDYDLAGFAVGAVERDGVVDGSRVGPGDALVGVASTGVHSNGYSLVRRIFGDDAALDGRPPELGGRSLGEALLEPTRIYARAVRALLERFRPNEELKALAHVTGGGIPGNLPRVLPRGVAARLDSRAWPRPAVFDLLARAGAVDEDEMRRVFNLGLGLIAVVPNRRAPEAVQVLEGAGFPAWVVGAVGEGAGEVEIA